MAGKKVNCIYNDSGCWCFHNKTKRAFVFFGARMCVAFENDEAICPLRVKTPKPKYPPKCIKGESNGK